MRHVFRIFFGARGTRPAIVLICMLLGALAEGVGLASLLPLLTIALGDSGGQASETAVQITGWLADLGISANIYSLMAIAIGAIVVKNGLALAAMTYVGYAVAHISTSLRRDLVQNLLNVRWSYFTRQPTGLITNALSVDATRAGQAYLSAATFLAYAMQSLIYAAVALFISWKVALLAIGVGAAVAFLLGRIVRTAKRAGRQQTRHTQQFVAYLTDALNNIKPLKAMERQAHFARLLERNISGLRRALRRQILAKQTLRSGSEVVSAVAIGIGFVLAVVYLDAPPAELATMTILLIQLVSSIGRVQREYQHALILESAYANVLDRIAESEAELERDEGTGRPTFEIGCRFAEVNFSHPRQPVLRDVTLDFPARKTTVITGPSGAGKTTIIDLILGFHRPDSGQILVDGRPLGELSLRQWRAMVGYVPQELVLFNDTIFANLTLGDPGIDERDVREALAAAGALDFVESMPDGLQTEVGEKGIKISGGQRQRIALARALVGHPRILILDEVTSALDQASERMVLENIRALRGETTVIAISHRSGILDIADRIYELDSGRVVHKRGRPPSTEAIAPADAG